MSWYTDSFVIKPKDTKNKRKLNRFKDDMLFQIVFNKLLSDYDGSFVVNGLPNTMNERVIKQGVLWGCVVPYMKNGTPICLPGASAGDISIYGEPLRAFAWSKNGQINDTVKLIVPGDVEMVKNGILPNFESVGDGVLVRDNESFFPFINVVVYLSECISDTLRTLDIVRFRLKCPYIFSAEESLVPSVKRFIEDLQGNMEVVVNTGVFPADRVNMMPFAENTNNLNNTISLLEYYFNLWNRWLGVDNNGNVNKQGENLLTSEIGITGQETDLQLDHRLEVMNKYMSIFNEAFGYQITFGRSKALENRNIGDGIHEQDI